MIYRFLFRVDRPYHPDRRIQKEGREVSILRTNRLINSEGTTVLYSEIHLVLGAGHFLRSPNWIERDITEFPQPRWHFYLDENSQLNGYDHPIYKASDLRRHPSFCAQTFQKFRHVILDIHLQYQRIFEYPRQYEVELYEDDEKRDLAKLFDKHGISASLVYLLSGL